MFNECLFLDQTCYNANLAHNMVKFFWKSSGNVVSTLSHVPQRICFTSWVYSVDSFPCAKVLFSMFSLLINYMFHMFQVRWE
jgi:hypothetical protein